MLKWIMAALMSVMAVVPAQAQRVSPIGAPVPAPAEAAAIPLYGSATPGQTRSENWATFGGEALTVRNVTRPTLTPVLPDPERANGTAVIVAPGGAFMMLAWEQEGMIVAQALADRGIAAFVLKYRLIPTPADGGEAARFMGQRMRQGMANPLVQPTLQYPPSTEDALAALAVVRARATEWHVVPQRVGMIGFSAGALAALNATLAADAAHRPDFIGYIYGPQPAVAVPADAPPMFAAIAFDDPLFPTQGFPIVAAWHAAGRPVELHAYGRGGHGFGLGIAGTTTTLMIEAFTAWITMQGLMTPKDDQ